MKGFGFIFVLGVNFLTVVMGSEEALSTIYSLLSIHYPLAKRGDWFEHRNQNSKSVHRVTVPLRAEEILNQGKPA